LPSCDQIPGDRIAALQKGAGNQSLVYFAYYQAFEGNVTIFSQKGKLNGKRYCGIALIQRNYDRYTMYTTPQRQSTIEKSNGAT
jgi:hypothetical protein